MIPTYRYSVSSPMPLDLNEDYTHQLFSINNQPFSSSSLSYSIIFNHDQDQGGSYLVVPKHLQTDEEAEKIVPSRGSRDLNENSSDLKLSTVWKKEDGSHENLQAEDSSVKWMPSKVRMMQRMMIMDQTGSDITGISKKNYEEQKLPLSLLGTDNSSNNSSNQGSSITVRVCSDCHTTKTPLWRSGPRGPKSLCNACGIRQRKARRAIAAANGTILVGAEKPHVKGNKLDNTEKKSKTECATKLKKKRKLEANANSSRGRKKFGFEDLTISLSKNLALQQVFPKDEKEAAILLMALSYGLLHGFPSDLYLDL